MGKGEGEVVREGEDETCGNYALVLINCYYIADYIITSLSKKALRSLNQLPTKPLNKQSPDPKSVGPVPL